MSARAARPSWFPGCARGWRSSCSCSSSREDGGGWACPDLPRPDCEGYWPLWPHRPGARNLSRAAQLLGWACPPPPLLLCLTPARSAVLRSPRPFPQRWGGGRGLGGPSLPYQPERAGVGSAPRRLRPLPGEPRPGSCFCPVSQGRR